MAKLIVEKYGYPSRCEVNRCTNRATVAVAREGAPRNLRQLYCTDCLNSLALQAASYLTDDTKKELASLIGVKGIALDAKLIENEIAQLKASLESKEAQIALLQQELEEKESTEKESEDAEMEANIQKAKEKAAKLKAAAENKKTKGD